jgi:glycerol-3-phosphate dehydrogenase
MNRNDILQRALSRKTPWDFVIIGGGATGMGVAIDAASRGYDVLLLEQHDFGKGTSSRSTKLVHGGVRYLEQGNIPLVREALKERALLRENAPHLVRELAFVVPNYAWWEAPFYGLGLKLYQTLSGRHGFGRSELLSKDETLRFLPNIQTDGLRGGVKYFDGQFDDSRLLIQMAATAVEQGATVLNYTTVTGLTRESTGTVNGVAARELEAGTEFLARARIVINATGAFCDAVRRLAEPEARELVAPSQGTHLVFDRSFLPGDTAIMVPHTRDHRVMFAIPWHDHTLVGTTDLAVKTADLEPRPTDEEIEFILSTAGQYLHKAPRRSDILSAFAGVRPLVRAAGKRNTASLSRGHTIHVDASGLLTITGGKWTTYRNMAEDCANQAAALAGLPKKACRTKALRIHGYEGAPEDGGALRVYGSDATGIQQLISENESLGRRLHADLPYCEAEVIWAARCEMARTVEDVLARRTRALFLNARAAIEMAPRVADLLSGELKREVQWRENQILTFKKLAAQYLPGEAA